MLFLKALEAVSKLNNDFFSVKAIVFPTSKILPFHPE
jgi:hypothetical protein